jgi:hypothetical protein
MSEKLSALNMKKISIAIFILFTSVVYAQSNLPACSSPPFSNCYGEWRYDNGNRYIGEWLNNNKDGFGTFVFSNGDYYAGKFKNDEINGQGTYTFVSGEKYVGQWKDAKRNGQGANTYASGNKYLGQWLNDLKEGQGTYYWKGGEQFVGQYKNGTRNGYGTYYNANGSINQQGVWKDDVLVQAQITPAPIVPEVVSGYPACTGSNWDRCYGEFTYRDGTKYQGQWLNSKRNGQGTFYWANGDKYTGQWVSDIKEGQASYIWSNGTKYVGQYKNDKRNGYGTYYNANGSINQQGMWKDDVLIQAQTAPPVIAPVVPRPPVPISNPQDIKRQKCIRLGLAPGSADFQQCMN